MTSNIGLSDYQIAFLQSDVQGRYLPGSVTKEIGVTVVALNHEYVFVHEFDDVYLLAEWVAIRKEMEAIERSESDRPTPGKPLP